MQTDVIRLTQDLIAIPSASTVSNAAIADFLAVRLRRLGFDVERLSYDDEGREKVSLVARIGPGAGGLGLFSHSDTVPGDPSEWEPFTPLLQDGRLIGRGSCDMKGPLAATIVAAAQVDARRLRKPLTLAITADEEVGYGGAYQIARESTLLKESWPAQVVVAEPTRLIPVYAHKGGARVYVTAYGRAAHTSTDRGSSANFLIAPFLAEMAELAHLFRQDSRFQNHEFDPPTNGFNLVIDDGNCKSNVTAAKTVATLSLRTMPNDHREEALGLILAAAQKYNLETRTEGFDPFYVAPDTEIVQLALQATGVARAETVPFGTEALVYQHYAGQQVILGPGDIAQAHTIGEWIEVAQLEAAVGVYQRLIERVCL
ncbi:MAG: acetylornithine deacetylase [Chloroflexi bacterium]|nr:MAG: acetylornithine deacetylase [Chloroflexota bacterium]